VFNYAFRLAKKRENKRYRENGSVFTTDYYETSETNKSLDVFYRVLMIMFEKCFKRLKPKNCVTHDTPFDIRFDNAIGPLSEHFCLYLNARKTKRNIIRAFEVPHGMDVYSDNIHIV